MARKGENRVQSLSTILKGIHQNDKKSRYKRSSQASEDLVELTETFWSNSIDRLMSDWEPNGMPYEDEFCENALWPWEREYQ
jgi:hypothetical protein